MFDGKDVVYLYDGSYEGLLCCVFESFTCRETPLFILPWDTSQSFLYTTKEITTHPTHARRVEASLAAKMCAEAKRLVELAFLHEAEEKSLLIYRFICLGYQHGARVVDMLAEETVSALHKLVKAVNNESHLMLGFLRFSQYGEGLVAVMEPKHFVLPLMQEHFCNRFPDEQFLIYDKTYGMALRYSNHQVQMAAISGLELPPVDATELQYRRLWVQYYHTIAIEARTNPPNRMRHIPKRFCKHITEMDPTNTLEWQVLPLAQSQNSPLISVANEANFADMEQKM